MDTEAAVDDISHTARDSANRPRAQVAQLQATKDNHRYDPWHACCELSKSNNKLSPYIRPKGHTSLNREGYRHQSTSRAYKSLQTELGLVDTGPMGVTDCSRVPLTPSGPASSDNSPITDALPSRPAKLDISGGGSDARETGSISSATQQRQLHLPVVCDSQEGRGILPSGEPEDFEQVHSRGAFQNGGLPYGEGSGRVQRLDGKDRLERCLLSSTSDEGSPEIPPIPVAGVHLSVCLPFGLSCAPRTFTKLMKPVVAFLRERGIRLIIYLDDILVLCNSRETLLSQLSLTKDLFQCLGLTINLKKSQLEPTQEIVFLGLHLSTLSMQVSLPTEKINKIKQEARGLLSKTEASVQRLAAFVGMTVAAKQAIRMSLLYHRHLQALINSVANGKITGRSETELP